MSREIVHIDFTYDTLNDLDRIAEYIRYLQSPSSQKDCIICDPEFGLETIGDVSLIHRASYTDKSAGCNLRNHLR